MIAADRSSLTAFLEGDTGSDIALIERAIADRTLVFAPPVVTELRSSVTVSAELEFLLSDARLLPIEPGLWTRAGRCRRLLLKRGFKAPFVDVITAQCCIDADVPLIARDKDYRHFERWCGLKLES